MNNVISPRTRSQLGSLLSENYDDALESLIVSALNEALDPFLSGARQTDILPYLNSLSDEDVTRIVSIVCREKRIIRSKANRKGVFDDRWGLFERFLRMDGIDVGTDGELIATEVMDLSALISREKIDSLFSSLPQELSRSTRRLLADAEESLKNLSYETLNGSISVYRTALETVYRAFGRRYAETEDSEVTWGKALTLLKHHSVISDVEEKAISAEYTLMSQFHAELLRDATDEFAFHRAITIFWILFIIERVDRLDGRATK